MLRQRCRSCGKLTHESIGSGSAHQEIFCIWLGVSNWDIVKHNFSTKNWREITCCGVPPFPTVSFRGRATGCLCCVMWTISHSPLNTRQNTGSPPFGKVTWNQEAGGKIVFKKSTRSLQYKIKIEQIPHQGRILFNQKKQLPIPQRTGSPTDFPTISVPMNCCHWRLKNTPWITGNPMVARFQSYGAGCGGSAARCCRTTGILLVDVNFCGRAFLTNQVMGEKW